MKRLRHPIRAIREPYGTAGLIVAMVALVAAVSGTALAAAKLNSTQKKEVEKIAKKFAGKPGPAGPTGPAGATGKDGAAGPVGATGPVGAAGAAGAPGKNGTDGTTGFTEKLPSGKTETGTWSVAQAARSEIGSLTVPISFSIPLAAPGAMGSALAFTVGEIESGEATTAGCTGTATVPTAPQGKLCVYTGQEEAVGPASLFREAIALSGVEKAYGISGAILEAGSLEGNAGAAAKITAEGSWAVTAP